MLGISLANSIGNVIIPPTFIPRNTPDLQLWLEPDDPATVTKSGADRMIQLDDKSINDNNAEQGTETNQPLFVASGINSKGSVDYSPNDEALVVTADATITDIWSGGGTLSMTINLNDDGGFAAGRLLSKDKWQILSVEESAGALKIQMDVITSGTNGQWITTDRDVTVGADSILTVTYDSDNIATFPVFRLDGVALALTAGSTPTGTYTSDSADNLVLGNLSALNRGMDGLMGEFALYSRTLSAAELGTLEEYLGS